MGVFKDVLRKALGVPTETQSCEKALLQCLASQQIQDPRFAYITSEIATFSFGPKVRNRVYYGDGVRGGLRIPFIAQVEANTGVNRLAVVSHINKRMMEAAFMSWMTSNLGGAFFDFVAQRHPDCKEIDLLSVPESSADQRGLQSKRLTPVPINLSLPNIIGKEPSRAFEGHGYHAFVLSDLQNIAASQGMPSIFDYLHVFVIFNGSGETVHYILLQCLHLRSIRATR